MNSKIIVFDFDGTIANSYDTFVMIINRLAPEFGYKPVGEEKLKQLRHLDSQQIIRQSEISLFKVPALLRRVKKEMAQEINNVGPIIGMEAALMEIKQQGNTLGIITSNTKENVVTFLQNNQLEHIFEFIYSGISLFGKDRIINKLIRKHKLLRETMIYVGDETRDIDAAKKSQIQVIAVGWGFNAPEILTRHQPDCLINNPSQLPKVITNSCVRVS